MSDTSDESVPTKWVAVVSPQKLPVIVRSDSGMYAPRQPSAAVTAKAGTLMINPEHSDDARRSITGPTRAKLTRAAMNTVDNDPFTDHRYTRKGTQGARAGPTAATESDFNFITPPTNIEDIGGHDTARTGYSPATSTFGTQTGGIDILHRVSAQDRIERYGFGGAMGLPTYPVPYYVYHPGGPTPAQREQALAEYRARNYTPAGPPQAMQYGIHIEKRHNRPNIDPNVWAIDEDLKSAWRLHMKGKGKARDQD